MARLLNLKRQANLNLPINNVNQRLHRLAMLVGCFAFGKVLHRTVIRELIKVSFGQFGEVLDFYEFLDEA